MREAAKTGMTCVNLRCGLFAGERYGLGLLPILLPRLKTHLVPWEPLVVRSIIHLLEASHADNAVATERLGYVPQVDWRMAIRRQVAEMAWRQRRPMPMSMPVH
ncbi:MAG: hypothetical protein LC646_06750 [Xanthomonadaceae bacterium]|nr:hypothetical protein [Xanthomonadaceae bacterium]